MPWPDMEALMRENAVAFLAPKLLHLCEFDIAGFTLQYEMSYSTFEHLLDLGGITRRPTAGGHAPHRRRRAAFNPEPLADFLDVVLLGDGEEAAAKLVEVYRRNRGLPR